MSIYDNLKVKPLPNQKCPQCGGAQKILFGWHPIYNVVCPKDHIHEINVSMIDVPQKENKI